MSTETGQAYERILGAMQEKYRALTGFDSDGATDIGIRLRVLAGELAALYDRMDDLQAQVFPGTSTGEYLERHAQQRGLRRKAAGEAQGVLRFSREVAPAQDIPIKAGVVCATRPEPQVQFVTTGSGVLRAGELFADVPARAVEAGAVGNVASGAVCLMVSAASGITAVSNPEPFSGGADGESDEALRERILSGYRDISNGTNRTFYYEAAMGCEGVESVNVVPRARGRGTVDVLIACASAPAQEAAAQRLQQELDQQKEINVDIRVRGARRRYVDLEVHIATGEYAEYDDVATRCNETVRAYMQGLGVGDTLLRARLGARLLAVEGVYNCRVFSPTADVVPEHDEILRPDAIAVRRMAVV